MVRRTRVYEESSRIRNNFYEGMSSFWMDVPIMIISLPNTVRNIDIVPLKEKIHFINIFLHAGMFRGKSLPTIGTLDLLFSLVPFVLALVSVRRLILLLVLLIPLGIIKLSLLILLLSLTLHIFGPRRKKCLIFGGSDDHHMHKLVMLICEGLNEGIEKIHFPIWGC